MEPVAAAAVLSAAAENGEEPVVAEITKEKKSQGLIELALARPEAFLFCTLSVMILLLLSIVLLRQSSVHRKLDVLEAKLEALMNKL